MLREDFDPWVEAHYGELLAVARRLVNNPEDVAEVVHEAVAQTLANGRLESIENPWTWMVNAVRGAAANARRTAARQKALRAGLYVSQAQGRGEAPRGATLRPSEARQGPSGRPEAKEATQ